MIGHVDVRIAADRAMMASIKNDLGQYIRKRREDLAFREWQEYLLTAHKFEDTVSQKKAVAEESEEAEQTTDDSPGRPGKSAPPEEEKANYIVD